MSKEKNINVKKKLDGNRLDLSLSDLSIVPVKEIVRICLPFYRYYLIIDTYHNNTFAKSKSSSEIMEFSICVIFL